MFGQYFSWFALLVWRGDLDFFLSVQLICFGCYNYLLFIIVGCGGIRDILVSYLGFREIFLCFRYVVVVQVF